MLGQPKPLASLSSTLLARKGQARPAMRPQGFAGLGPAPERLEDLGWDDMGHKQPASAEPTPIAPAVEPLPAGTLPSVLLERQALRHEIASAQLSANEKVTAEGAAADEAPRAVKSVSVATAGRLQRETSHVGRAAFTLRLDAQRHLKLRLASALAHRSAQQLLCHALDEFLTTLPEVATLVAQLPDTPAPKRKSR